VVLQGWPSSMGTILLDLKHWFFCPKGSGKPEMFHEFMSAERMYLRRLIQTCYEKRG
jgi:hypothetical protein